MLPKGRRAHVRASAYVFYQVTLDARGLPLVFWHGHGQSGKTWEATPDGREGFQTIFLRRGYPVYVIDQPRRGRAARSTALEQFFRQSVPNTGPYNVDVNTSAVAALFDKIGPGVLVTHSQSGTLGWRTAFKSKNIRAIVSYEPGGDFVFPEGEAPPPMKLREASFVPPTVPLSDFMQLTKMPILVYYGDNIPEQPSTNPGQEQWRVFRATARLWRDAVNNRGGAVTLVDLPSIGIKGNTHFPMSDLNNLEVANHLAEFLQRKGLDSKRQ